MAQTENKKRILIVDDDETILETLQLILEEEGYTVDMAKTGKEAIDKTYGEFYNLAIIDWKLPDIEGTKLLTGLKETVPRMAKIMLTGYPSMENAIASVNARADAFFQKPVSFDLVLKKVKELLELQEGEQKFSEQKMSEYVETRMKALSPSEGMFAQPRKSGESS